VAIIVLATAGIFLHHVKAIGGNIELRSLGVLQLQKLSAVVSYIQKGHATVAPNAIVNMDHPVSSTQSSKVKECLMCPLRRRRGTLAFFTKDVRRTQHHQALLRPDKPLTQFSYAEDNSSWLWHGTDETLGVGCHRETLKAIRDQKIL
jgi:hypothetical protein